MRDVYLATARVAVELLARPEVGAAWDGPSCLPEFSVRGLAGHLTRGTVAVLDYLAADEPVSEPIDAAEYFAIVASMGSIDSAGHVGVRQRGEDAAAGGQASVVSAMQGQIAQLEQRLAVEPADRLMTVLGGLVLRLDDYLVTRLIELTVHMDDLAVSVGVDTPEYPAEAGRLAAHALLDAARSRHGDVAVLRALTRAERTPPGLFPVL